MSDQYENNRYKYNILDVCDALHSFVTGSSDPEPLHEVVDMYEWLAWRVNNWHGNKEPKFETVERYIASGSYDGYVYGLCCAALAESTSMFRELAINPAEVRLTKTVGKLPNCI